MARLNSQFCVDKIRYQELLTCKYFIKTFNMKDDQVFKT